MRKNIESMAEELFQYIRFIIQRGPMKKIQGLSQGEMAMLHYFVLEKPKATPTELSERFCLSTARIANILNSLEKKRYVRRIHDSADRRKVFVHITELGRKTVNFRKEEASDTVKELPQGLGEEDSADLLRILRKVHALLQEKERCNEVTTDN